MPVTTRSQARSVQSTDLVSSPRANTPRLTHDSRQGNAGVTDSINEGAPFESVAYGNHASEICCINVKSNNFKVKKCKDKRCKTCKYLIISDEYYSNHSKRIYKIINHSEEDLSCNSKNLVYLLTCRGCNIQYVGETLQPLHKRMNTHRNSKSGCEKIINHYKTCTKEFNFNIQIII